MNQKKFITAIFFTLVLSITLKVILLILQKFPFNADEAIVGLMSRHILAGERPVFFYGQAYMGSLDAYFIAGAFALFGQEVWVIRAVQILLYLLIILSGVILSKQIFGSPKAGIITSLLLSIPTVNITLYTTVSLGGYGEALLIGNLILLVGLKAYRIENEKPRTSFLWKEAMIVGLFGFLCGLGFWANALTMVYTLPTGLFVILSFWMQRKHQSLKRIILLVFSVVFGILIGLFPILTFLVRNGTQTLLAELFGSAVAVETTSFFARSLQHLLNFFIFGITVLMGIRPPWGVHWLVFPMIPIVLFIWGFVLWRLFKNEIKNLPDKSGVYLLFGICCVLILSFLFTSFGADPSGRYFLPLFIVFCLITGFVIDRLNIKGYIKTGIVGGLIVYNLLGIVQCAYTDPPGFTTQFDSITIVDHSFDQELIEFLKANHEYYGYSNYWVAYPLAFNSGEELIYVPRLPYHTDQRYTERDDRYPIYTQMVLNADRVAYITTHNPELDKKIVNNLKVKGISWQEKIIGDYRIYYNLSRVVHPWEIDLGKTK